VLIAIERSELYDKYTVINVMSSDLKLMTCRVGLAQIFGGGEVCKHFDITMYRVL